MKNTIINFLRIIALVIIFLMGVIAISGSPAITLILVIIPIVIDIRLENISLKKELGKKAAYYHEHFWDIMLAYTCIVCLIIGGIKLWNVYQNGVPDSYYEYMEMKEGKGKKAVSDQTVVEETVSDADAESSISDN